MSEVNNQVLQKFNELIIPSRSMKCTSCDSSISKKKDKNLLKCDECGTYTCYLCNKSISSENISSHFDRDGCKLFTIEIEDLKLLRFKNLKKIRDHFINDTSPRSHDILYCSNKENTDVQVFKVDGVDLLTLRPRIRIGSNIEIMKVNYIPDRNDAVIANHIHNNDFIITVLRSEGDTYAGRLHFNHPFLREGEVLPLFVDSASNKHFVLSKNNNNPQVVKGSVQNCGIFYHNIVLKRDTLETKFGFRYIVCKNAELFYSIVSGVDDNSVASEHVKEGDEIVSVNGQQFSSTQSFHDFIKSLLEIKITIIRPFRPSVSDTNDYANLENWRNHTNKSTIIMKGTMKIPHLIGEDGSHNYMYGSKINRVIPGIACAFNMKGTFQHNGKEYNDEFIMSTISRSNHENLQRLGFHVFNNVHFDFHYITANGSNQFGDYVAVGYICNRKYTMFRNYVPKKINIKRPLETTNVAPDDNDDSEERKKRLIHEH